MFLCLSTCCHVLNPFEHCSAQVLERRVTDVNNAEEEGTQGNATENVANAPDNEHDDEDTVDTDSSNPEQGEKSKLVHDADVGAKRELGGLKGSVLTRLRS